MEKDAWNSLSSDFNTKINRGIEQPRNVSAVKRWQN